MKKIMISILSVLVFSIINCVSSQIKIPIEITCAISKDSMQNIKDADVSIKVKSFSKRKKYYSEPASITNRRFQGDIFFDLYKKTKSNNYKIVIANTSDPYPIFEDKLKVLTLNDSFFAKYNLNRIQLLKRGDYKFRCAVRIYSSKTVSKFYYSNWIIFNVQNDIEWSDF